MSRSAPIRGRLFAGTISLAAVWAGLALPAAEAGNPSVCVIPEGGCHVVDGQVNFTIALGQGTPKIAGGQFAFTYDPSALDFVAIEPGRTCDPNSPFTQPLFRDVDESAGTIFLAVSVSPFSINESTQGPATLACVTFVARSAAPSKMCLVHGTPPLVTILSDDFGNSVPIDNTTDCAPTPPTSALSCASVPVASSCTCIAGVPNCRNFDSDCSMGFCEDATGRCESMPINEKKSCDDLSSCTSNDTCTDGVCSGTDCSLPSVCIVSDVGASEADGTVNLRVEAGPTNARIAGAQFLAQYDPATLRFVDISPGVACDPFTPFDTIVFQSVDEIQGEIFYSVTLDRANIDMETFGPATLACLTFQILATPRSKVCLMSRNPLNTILADEFGGSLPISNAEDCPSILPPPILTCDQVTKIIPTTSDWGVVIMALILVIAGKLAFGFIPSRTG